MFKINPETYTMTVTKGDFGIIPIQLKDANGNIYKLGNRSLEDLYILFEINNSIIVSKAGEFEWNETNQCYYYTLGKGNASDDLPGDYFYSVILKYTEGNTQKTNTLIPRSLYRILPKIDFPEEEG